MGAIIWIAGCIVFLAIIYLIFKKRNVLLFSIHGWPNIVFWIAFLWVVLCFIGYQIQIQKQTSLQLSNIVFLLDVSKSMDVSEYNNASRLMVAKDLIKNYVLESPQNKYALTIFSGDVTNVIPLTSDKDIFLTLLESIDSSSIVKAWTNIPDALEMWIQRIQDIQEVWAVVILSDFETRLTSEQQQNFLNQISKKISWRKKENIKFYLVWLWTTQWWTIVSWYDIFWRAILLADKFWNNIISQFDNNFFVSFWKILQAKNIYIWVQQEKEILSLPDLPVQENQQEQKISFDISRIIMIWVYAFLMLYMILFYYFDRKWSLKK